MILRPPRSTRTAPLFPYTTLFRSELAEQTIADRGSARRDVGRFGRIGCQVEKLGVGAAEPGEQLPIALADGEGRRAIVLHRGLRSLLGGAFLAIRSEEHTSELQSIMRISYAVFCLKKKQPHTHH